MKKLSLLLPFMTLLTMIFGCGGEMTKPVAEWTKARKIAGKEQKLSHVSGLVVDEKFAYVTTGGNLADQQEGLSGLRKIALETGAVTSLDDGKNLPQSDYGGVAADEKYVYWNADNKIFRILKDGGKPEIIASENVGGGIDMVVDGEKVYWANHGYYSPNNPIKPSPLYSILKQGGKTEIFTELQKIPTCPVTDEKFVYWLTSNGVMKQAKSGGAAQVVYQANAEENVDQLSQDADNLYFGFRSAGNSNWAILKVSKQGGAAQTLVKSYASKQFTVDDANVYFFNSNSTYKDDLCKVSKNGGEIVTLDHGYASGVIAQSKTLVYFAGLDDVYSFPK